MTTINVSDIELTVNCFRNNKTISSVDCNYTSWKDNSLTQQAALLSYYGAFENCTNLVSVYNLDESITNMAYAFNKCSNLTSISYIPENVVDMSYTFNGCTNLSSEITIPENVNNMSYTFNSCNKINKVYIKSEIISSANGCFNNTSINKEVYIPFYTKTYYTFSDAGYNTSSSKNGVTLKEDMTHVVNTDGWYIKKETNDILKYVGSSTSVIVPEVVETRTINSILRNTFVDTSIESIDLTNAKFEDNSLYRAFNKCSYLTTVINIPNTITNMSYTFGNCTSLTDTPVIPNSVTKLPSTFDNCTSLVNILNIPNSVTSLSSTFYKCTSLVNAPVIPNSVTILTYTFGGCSNLINAPEIPNSVTTINSAFSGCTSLVNAPVIPNSVIGMSSTFTNCKSLINAPIIPNSVTSLSSTFDNCKSLINAPVIPNSVTLLSYTFDGCTNLINAPVIPNSVTNINGTFAGCINLINVPAIPNSIQYLQYTFNGCTSLTDAPEMPSTITNMETAYLNCTSLINIPAISESMVNMTNSFKNCTSLVNAPVIPSGVKILANTFNGCTSLTGDVFINSEIVVNTSNCFSNTSLNKDVYIPLYRSETLEGYLYAFTISVLWVSRSQYLKEDPMTLEYNVQYKVYDGNLEETGYYAVLENRVGTNVAIRCDNPQYNTYTLWRNNSANDRNVSFKAGNNSSTYNSFKSLCGYSTTTRKDGVILKDINTLLQRTVVLQETSEGESTPTFWSDDKENFEIGSLLSEGTWKACWGNGRYVAVKRNSNVGAYSIDGKHWYEVTLPVTGYWNAIAYGAGVFVATSLQSTDIIYSTDGITWTSATTPSGWQQGGAIVFGSTHFVVGDVNHTKYMTSTDGINWTMGVSAARLPYIGYNHNTGVMLSYGWRSTDDGLTWSSVNKPSDYSVGSYKGIYEFGNDFVAIKRNTNGFLVYIEDMSGWLNIGGLEVYPDSYVSTGSNSGIFLDTSNKLFVVDDIANLHGQVVELEDATQINTLIYSKE